MRPEERIDIFCKVLAEEWKKQGVDLRFTQFLCNNGIRTSSSEFSDLYHLEEIEFLQKHFPDINPSKYVLWGTYGKDGRDPLKYIKVCDMESEHIKAILSNYKSGIQPLLDFYVKVFNDELESRNPKKKPVSDTKVIINALKNMPDKKTLKKKYEKYTKKVDKKKKK